MSTNTKQILNTDNESARFVTGIEGWVDRNGRFFGNDKRAARWAGCTHIICPDCGRPTPKNYLRCADCRKKKAVLQYNQKEHKKWDGEIPIYSDMFDKYFFDEDALHDFMEECECEIEELRLIICEPIYLKEIREDYFCDALADDGELSEAVIDALDNLNAVIRDEDPVSWFPGKYAADIEVQNADKSM